MRKIFLIVFILIGLSPKSQSQALHLTLEESIEIAKRQSFRMLSLEQDLKMAEQNLKSATRRLRTHVDLSISLPSYTESVLKKSDTSLYYSVKQLSFSGNLTVNQPLPTDGRIYIENRVNTLKDYYAGQNLSDVYHRIGLEQPLDAFYGYNTIRSTLKRARLEYEQTNKMLKREELNLVYQVSSEYYNLLSIQKGTEISKMDLERQTEAQEISKNKYDAGLIREVDALQMEVELAETQSNYDMSLLNQSSAVNSFKDLLGLDLNDSIMLSSDLNYQVTIIDPKKAVEYALRNRSEIRDHEINIELEDLNIKRQKAQGMIKGSLNAHYGRTGVYRGETDMFKSISDSYRDLGDRPSNFGVGLTIRIPILDWGENRALVRSAEARLKKVRLSKENTERGIETEVKNLVAKVSSNLNRLQLLEKNIKVAEKSFEITRQRYSDGDIDSQALALERERLNRAYRSHLDSYITYQLSLSDIMRKTYFDFQNNIAID